jgi:hypothetical protein
MKPSAPPSVRRSVVLALAAIVCAGAILLAAYFSWRMVMEEPWLRMECLVACIVAGVGATVCLAGAMHFLDQPLQVGATKWYVRWLLKINKRILLVAELATTGLAIAAAGILIFGFRIPGATPH